MKDRAANKRWRAQHPERARAIDLAKYKRHKEKIYKRVRAWQKSNPDKTKLYTKRTAERYPEARRARVRNRRAKQRQLGGSHTAADIISILKSQRGRCAYCRCKLDEEYHVDHIVPVVKGGGNDKRNLQITCAPCNQSKFTRDAIDFARGLGMLI